MKEDGIPSGLRSNRQFQGPGRPDLFSHERNTSKAPPTGTRSMGNSLLSMGFASFSYMNSSRNPIPVASLGFETHVKHRRASGRWRSATLDVRLDPQRRRVPVSESNAGFRIEDRNRSKASTRLIVPFGLRPTRPMRMPAIRCCSTMPRASTRSERTAWATCLPSKASICAPTSDGHERESSTRLSRHLNGHVEGFAGGRDDRDAGVIPEWRRSPMERAAGKYYAN